MADVPLTLSMGAKGVDTTTKSIDRVTASVDRMRKMQVKAVAVGNIMANAIQQVARVGVQFAQGSLQQADAIAKNARAIGMSTDAYQKLQFAASRTGVGFQQAQVAIQQMQRAIVTGHKSLERLGVEMNSIRGMRPEQQFATLGRELMKLQDPAQRTAIAMDLFGRQGARIVEMAGSFEDLSAEAQRLGIIMDEGALRTAEKFNDMVSDLRLRLQALFVNAIPAIKLFGQVWLTEIKFIGEVFWAWAQSVWDFWTSLPATVMTVVRNIVSVFHWMFVNWRDIAFNMAQYLTNAFMNTIENIKRLWNSLKQWVAGQGWTFEGKALGEGSQLRSIAGPEMESIAFLDRTLDRFGKTLDRRRESLDAAQQEYQDAVYGMAEASRSASDIMPDREASAQRGKGLSALVQGSVEAASAIARYMAGDAGMNIEKQQLRVLNGIERGINNISLNVEEYAIG
jgi:hypothetical protein